MLLAMPKTESHVQSRHLLSLEYKHTCSPTNNKYAHSMQRTYQYSRCICLHFLSWIITWHQTFIMLPGSDRIKSQSVCVSQSGSALSALKACGESFCSTAWALSSLTAAEFSSLRHAIDTTRHPIPAEEKPHSWQSKRSNAYENTQ